MDFDALIAEATEEAGMIITDALLAFKVDPPSQDEMRLMVDQLLANGDLATFEAESARLQEAWGEEAFDRQMRLGISRLRRRGE